MKRTAKLASVLMVLAFLCVPFTTALAAGVPTIEVTRPYVFLNDVAKKIVEKTNAKRAAAGVAALTENEHLNRTAQYKSLYSMQYLKKDGSVFVEHAFGTGPAKTVEETVTDSKLLETGGKEALDKLAIVNAETLAYTANATLNSGESAENVADTIIAAWENSTDHKATMLSKDYKSIGVGVVMTDKGMMFIQHYSKSIPTSSSAIPTSMTDQSKKGNGWFKRTNGKWSYAQDEQLKTGWFEEGGKRYYLSPTGIMATKWMREGSTWYFFNDSGAMYTGWKKDGKWYYLDPATGKMATGVITVDGKKYRMNGATGAMMTGWVKEEGKWYYMHKSGYMYENKWLKENNKWYYMGQDGVMATGWADVDGKRYYLTPSGAMAKNWARLSGVWYYLGSDGAARTGWTKVSGKWYLMDNTTGAMQTGWKQAEEGGPWYYMNRSGAMQTGWVKAGSKWYYLHRSGAMMTGWQTLGSKKYYLHPESGAMATGTIEIEGQQYTFDANGALQSE